MYNLRKNTRLIGFYKQRHQSQSASTGSGHRFNAKRQSEMRSFMIALERSLVHELRFKKLGPLLRSDQLVVSKSVFNRLREDGVKCKFTNGWSWLTRTVNIMCMRLLQLRWIAYCYSPRIVSNQGFYFLSIILYSSDSKL